MNTADCKIISDQVIRSRPLGLKAEKYYRNSTFAEAFKHGSFCILPSSVRPPNDVRVQNFPPHPLYPAGAAVGYIMKMEGNTRPKWWILFGLRLLSPSLAAPDCCVGFYGEKQRACQTLSCTGIKKKEKHVRGWSGGGMGGWKFDPRNSEGCGFPGSETGQTESVQQTERPLFAVRQK